MKQILLVDDDVQLLEGLQRQFRPHREHWNVEVASSGEQALRMARERPIDLIITDLLMPGTDGIEIVITCRREHPEMKLIAMSGGGRRVRSEPLHCARLLGADTILEKPFEFQDLRDAVWALLESHPETSRPGP
jgi:DNA-binding response OmpR family regulator